MKHSILALAALAAVAACGVSDSGKIPCYDNFSCPADYPVCQGADAGAAGVCVTSSGGQPTGTENVQITQLEGYPAKTSVVRGTVRVDVLALADSGVRSVSLTAGSGAPLAPISSSNNLYTFAVDTTLVSAPVGTLLLTASLVAGDGSSPAPDTLTISYDNEAPTLTVSSFGPADARIGSMIELDLTSSEALSSLTGTVLMDGTAVAMMAESGPTSSTSLDYRLTWQVPEGAAAGSYTVEVDATDLAGNADPLGAAVTPQSFTVLAAFTLQGLALSSPTVQESGFAAGKTGTPIVAQLSLASSIASAVPTFTLTDAIGATRTFAAAPTSATSGQITTWTSIDLIESSDASGLATITATLVDPSGNSASATALLIIDHTPPSVSGLAVAKAIVDSIDATETITATASEALSAASISVSNGAAGSCTIANQISVTCTIPLAAVTSATAVTATLTLTDLVGNVSGGGAAYQATYSLVPVASATSLTSSAATITAGTGATLTAIFANGTASINGSSVQTGQPLTVAPATTTLYTLTVTDGAGHGDSSKSTTIAVVAAPSIGIALAASASSITLGQSVTLTAAFSNGTATLNGSAFTGSAIVTPSATGAQTFTLLVSNAATAPATLTQSVTVQVAAAPGGVTLSGATTITIGGSATLTAGTFTGGTGVVNPGGLSVASGGTVTVSPSSTTSYTLTVTDAAGGASGTSTSSPVAVTVVQAPTLSGALLLNPSTITQGDSAVGVTAPTFSASVVSASVQIVNGAGNPLGSSQSIASGATISLTASTVQALAAGTYSIVLTALNGAANPAQAQASATLTVVGAAGAFSGSAFAVTPTTIASGAQGNLAFTIPTFGANVTSALLTGNGATLSITSAEGAVALAYPSSTTTYVLTPYNAAGKAGAIASATVTVLANASFGTGSFAITTPANATITGGTSGTLSFSIPKFGASVTSASLLDPTGAAAKDGSGNTITAAAILAAGASSTSLTVGRPVTNQTDNDTLTYTLNASNAVSSAALTTSLVVVPLPTSVTLFNSADTITSGGSLELTASSFTGGTGVVNPGGISIVSGGTITVAPATSTTYTLVVTDAAGDSVSSPTVSISVVAAPTATGSLSISPTAITQGDASVTATAPTFGGSFSAQVQVNDKNGSKVINAASISSGGMLALNTASFTSAASPYSVVLTLSNQAIPPSTLTQTASLIVAGSPGAFTGSTFAVSPSTLADGAQGNLAFTIPTFGANVTTALLTGNGETLAVTSAQTGVTLPDPSSTTTYVLTPYNAAGRAGTTATATVTVFSSALFGSGSFAITGPSNATVTGSSTGTLTFSIPEFAASVTSATFTDASGTAVKDGTGTPITSAAILAAGNAGTALTVEMPVTQLTDHDALTYTLTAINSATSASVTTNLIVVPQPTSVSLFGSTTITQGSAATLTASSFSGGTGVVNPGGLSIASGGTITVAPSTSTTYTLVVTDAAGDSLGTVTSLGFPVSVVAAPTVTGNLSVSPSTITQGDASVTATAPAFAASFSAQVQVNDKSGSKVINGASISSAGTLALNTSSLTSAASPYSVVLTVANQATPASTLTQTAVLTVAGSPGAFSGSTFAVSPATLVDGAQGNLSFTIPTFGSNVTSALLTGNGATVSVTSAQSGVALANPSSTTTYVLTPYNAAGRAGTPESATVTVVAGASFGSGSFAITTPANATITGSSTGTLSFSIPAFEASVTSASLLDPLGVAVKDGSGTTITSAAILAAGTNDTKLTVAMPATSLTDNDSLTYTLSASNAVSSASLTTKLTVVPQPTDVNLSISEGTVTIGDAVTLIASAFSGGTGVINPGAIPIESGGTVSVVPAHSTSYTLVVTDAAADTLGTVTSDPEGVGVAGVPTVTGALSVSPAAITQGDATATATAPSFNFTDSGSVAVLDVNGNTAISSASISSGGMLTLNTTGLTSANSPYSVVLTIANAASTPDTLTQTASLTVAGSPGAFSGSTFAVTPTSLSQGDMGSLSFTIPTFGANVTTALLSGSGGTLAVTSAESGVTLPYPSSSTTYVLTPYNAAGLAGTSESATVSYSPDIASFTGNAVNGPYAGSSGTTVYVGNVTAGQQLTFNCSYTPTTATAQITGDGDFATPVSGSCSNVSAQFVDSPSTFTLTVTSGSTSVLSTITAIPVPWVFEFQLNNTISSHVAIGAAPTMTALYLHGSGVISVSSSSGGSSGDSTMPLSPGTANGSTPKAATPTLAPTGTGNGTEAVLNYLLTVTGTTSNSNTAAVNATQTATLYVDPGSWSTLSTSAAITNRFGATVTALGNGKVLIAGGCTDAACSAAPLNTAIVCNSSGSCSAPTGTVPTMFHARAFAQAVLLPVGTNAGKVLITGGYTAASKGTPTATAELYDPTADSFTAAPPSMKTARAEHTSTVMSDGSVLNLGGFTSGTTATASADAYNANATSNSTVTAMTGAARAQHTATLLGATGNLLVVGGSGDTTTRICTWSSGNCSWSSGGAMNEAKSLHAAVAISSGANQNRVLLCGGVVGGTVSANCSLSDAAGATFTSVAALNTARSSLAAIELPDFPGKVLFCGGNSSSAAVNACDVEDTTSTAGSTSWLTTQTMAHARASFGLVSFSSGAEVFAAGGDSVASDSAETYNPD